MSVCTHMCLNGIRVALGQKCQFYCAQNFVFQIILRQYCIITVVNIHFFLSANTKAPVEMQADRHYGTVNASQCANLLHYRFSVGIKNDNAVYIL